MYYFNDVTLNIGCHRSCPISAMTQRVSEEPQSRVWIRGCRVQRGLRVTFGGGGGLRAAFRGGVRQGVRVEGACSSVGNCWKELGMGSTLKHLWNWEVVRVWSEVVRGRPVFHSENILEFFQLQPWTPLAFFGLQLPLSSGDTSEYFLF